jgi:hypothetical protein
MTSVFCKTCTGSGSRCPKCEKVIREMLADIRCQLCTYNAQEYTCEHCNQDLCSGCYTQHCCEDSKDKKGDSNACVDAGREGKSDGFSSRPASTQALLPLFPSRLVDSAQASQKRKKPAVKCIPKVLPTRNFFGRRPAFKCFFSKESSSRTYSSGLDAHQISTGSDRTEMRTERFEYIHMKRPHVIAQNARRAPKRWSTGEEKILIQGLKKYQDSATPYRDILRDSELYPHLPGRTMTDLRGKFRNMLKKRRKRRKPSKVNVISPMTKDM